MYTSLFVSAFLASVMAQTDNSPLTTVTLAASAILGPVSVPTIASSPSVLPTITNLSGPLSTITRVSSVAPVVVAAASSEPTVYQTSIITSTVCGSCAPKATGAIVAAVPSTLVVSVSSSSVAAVASGVPYGGSAAFPVSRNNATTVNGTVVAANAADKVGAGSIALTAGLLAASYFAFAL